MTPILEAVAQGRNGTIHGYRQLSQPPHPSQLLIELDLEVALKQKEHRHRVSITALIHSSSVKLG
jgi:hypothetical protein